MMSVILNIIGIILIIYSIYIIKKDFTKPTTSESELGSIEEKVRQYDYKDKEIVEDFDGLIEAKLDRINTEKSLNDRKDIEPIIGKNIDIIISDDIEDHGRTNPIHKKIIDLKTIGLTNEEIARKLNRGIREIEIVLKMQQKNK